MHHERNKMSRKTLFAALAVAGLLVGFGNPGGGANAGEVYAQAASGGGGPKSLELLNVSYDPTRELWRDINAAFIPKYTDAKLEIKQSHGGSSTQAPAGI